MRFRSRLFLSTRLLAAFRLLTVLGALPLFGLVAEDRFSAPLERTATYRLAGHVRAFASPANDRGRVAPDMPMPMMTIALAPTVQQKADLDAFLRDVQDPASPNYHRFLTPEAYADRFGASAADIDKVAAWLTGKGLTVEQTAKGRWWIRFHGTAAQVESAFATEIHRYSVRGESHYASAKAPALPASLGPVTMAIRGLDDLGMRSRGLNATPKANSASAHSLAPGDIATIYNTSPLLSQGIDGTGQKVLVLGTAGLTQSDVDTYRSQFGLPARTIQQNLIGGSFTPDQGDLQQSAMAVELVGAVAPGANIILAYGINPEAVLAAAIDNNAAPVISSSFSFGYGLCDATDYETDAIYLQAEVQYGNALGITVVNASGNLGPAGCDASGAPAATLGKGVGLPAAIPEVTAVGGTEFREATGAYWGSSAGSAGGTALSYTPEIAWNDTASDGFLSASGGGASVLFPKPFWQTGSGVPNDGARDVPDIAFSASSDHDPYYICWNGGAQPCFGIGGTGAAAPLAAGMVVLLNHYQVSKGFQTAAGQGNLNPGLYRMAQAVPTAFHDVTAGDNVVPCSIMTIDCTNGYLGFPAGVGYDLVTGLGSLDAFNLVSNWNSNAGTIATTTTLGAGTGAIAQNSALLVTVTVKSAAGSGTPTGTVTFNATPNRQITQGASQWTFVGKANLSGSGGTATGSMNFYPAQFGGYPPASITAVYSGDGTYRSSGQTVSISVFAASNKNSVVSPAINGGATNQGVVYPGDPDSDGYRYFFELDLYEINGVATTLTDMKIDGVSYAPQLGALFGGTQLPAYGSLAAKIRWNPPTSPYTTYVEVSGKDASGAAWTQQTPLIVVARQLFGNLVLVSDPEPVQPTSSATCPYSQQLELFETNGHAVQLTNFYQNSTDLSSSIQSVWGTMRLAPYGTAIAQICFAANPASVSWEVDGTDDLGTKITGTYRSSYTGLRSSVPSLSVSPAKLSLGAPAASQTASGSVTITVPGAQPWAIYTYPANKTTNWLNVYPTSGTGSATVQFTASGAGLLSGAYLAQVVVTASNSYGTNTAPAIVNIPVVFTIGNTGGISIGGLQNAASHVQSYAPGMLMAVYGVNLSPGTQIASTIPLPARLQGVSATVNGLTAPLWFVSPGQINLQIPYEVPGGQAMVAINNNGRIAYSLFQVTPAAPGIFSLNGSINPDATVRAGGQAFLYMTGDGDATYSLATGATPPSGTSLGSLPAPLGTVSVTVGGRSAQVIFAGITSGSVGITQVNFQIPAGLTGVQPVVVTVNGVTSLPVNLTVTN